GERADELQFGGRLAATDGVIFLKSFAVDPHAAVVDVDGFTGQPDDALDVVGLRGIEGRLKDDDLLALGFAPQRNVNIGEGNSGIVADAAHDEVIANEQGVFHGAGRNDAGLAEGAVDEHKGENDPKPGDGLAFDLGAHGDVRFLGGSAVFGFSFDCVSFHDSPYGAMQRHVHSSRGRWGLAGLAGLKSGHYMGCSTVTGSVAFPLEEDSRTSSCTRSVG